MQPLVGRAAGQLTAWTCSDMLRQVGWVEQKMQAAARAVKRARPGVWTLRYINGLVRDLHAQTCADISEVSVLCAAGSWTSWVRRRTFRCTKR
jgi:hypothetical protein